MASITYTIDDAKLPRVKAGMLEVYPNNETIDDPAWVDPQDGSEAPQLPKYTDNEWLKEVGRRFFRDTVRRGEAKAAQRLANEGLTEADSLVS